MLRKSSLLVISLLLLGAVTAMAPLSANATSPIIQQASGGCLACSSQSSTVSFPGSVTSGDIIVVGVSAFFNPNSPPTPPDTVTVSDTFGSSYTEAVSSCNYPGYANCAFIYYSTASTSGADSVRVSVSNGLNPESLDIFVYELSGFTTAGSAAGIGEGGFSDFSQGPADAVSTNPTAFGSPTAIDSSGFVLGIISMWTGSSAISFTPGSGFTGVTGPGGISGPYYAEGFAQYSVGGVSSPTAFPGLLGAEPEIWTEVGLALVPTVAPAPSVAICPNALGGMLVPVGGNGTASNGNAWAALGC